MMGRGVFVLALLLCGLAPLAASAQSTPAPAGAGAVTPVDPSGWSVVLGGTATTLRGDCQEDCPSHGTGAYLHTGSVLGMVRYALSRHIDAGAEVSWVPVTLVTGDHSRATFLLGAAEYRPWPARGFFLKAAAGMAFVRNFQYDAAGTLPPVTSKGLGLSYAAGWTLRRGTRVGVQVFGAQHVAALGDFQTSQGTINDVIGNFWSVGAAIVIR